MHDSIDYSKSYDSSSAIVPKTLENRFDVPPVILESPRPLRIPLPRLSHLNGLVLFFEVVVIPDNGAFPYLLHLASCITKARIIWIVGPKRCIYLQYPSAGCPYSASFGMQAFIMTENTTKRSSARSRLFERYERRHLTTPLSYTKQNSKI